MCEKIKEHLLKHCLDEGYDDVDEELMAEILKDTEVIWSGNSVWHGSVKITTHIVEIDGMFISFLFTEDFGDSRVKELDNGFRWDQVKEMGLYQKNVKDHLKKFAVASGYKDIDDHVLQKVLKNGEVIWEGDFEEEETFSGFVTSFKTIVKIDEMLVIYRNIYSSGIYGKTDFDFDWESVFEVDEYKKVTTEYKPKCIPNII